MVVDIFYNCRYIADAIKRW